MPMSTPSAAKTKSGFYHALFRELNDVLLLTRPRLSVTLALDGPAPLAKLLTQRCGGGIPFHRHSRFSSSDFSPIHLDTCSMCQF